MIEIRRILCPVDFSEFSAGAVRYAVGMASRYGAEIHALHVVPIVPTMWAIPPTVNPDTLEPMAPEALSAEMEALLAPARESRVETRVHAREGDAAREIVAYARENDVDLVVMGTHGRGGFERVVLGSVAEKVIRKADCPVMTVCHASSTAVAGPPFERILCPVDFSPASQRAVDYALSLAEERDAVVGLLHVSEPYYHRAILGAGLNAGEYDRFVEADIRERLKHLGDARARERCRVGDIVRTGRVWEEILAVADEMKADVIVMGVHGHGALDTLIFGSNTNQVVRRATCPVLSIGRQRLGPRHEASAHTRRHTIVI